MRAVPADVEVRRQQAPRRPRGGRPRRRGARGPQQAPLPQPGPDRAGGRTLDQPVRSAFHRRAGRPREGRHARPRRRSRDHHRARLPGLRRRDAAAGLGRRHRLGVDLALVPRHLVRRAARSRPAVPHRAAGRHRRRRRDDRGDGAAHRRRAGPVRADLARALRHRHVAGATQPGRVDDRGRRRRAHPGPAGARRPRLQPADVGEHQGRVGLVAGQPEDAAGDRATAPPRRGRRGPARRRRPATSTAGRRWRPTTASGTSSTRTRGRRTTTRRCCGARTPRPTTGSAPRARGPRTRRGRAGSCRRCCCSPGSRRPRCAAPTAALRRASCTPSSTSTSPTPTRDAPGRSPRSAGRTRLPTRGPVAVAVPVADAEDREVLERDLAVVPPGLGAASGPVTTR